MLVDEALAADGDAIPTLRTGPGANGWQASIARLRGLFNARALRSAQLPCLPERTPGRPRRTPPGASAGQHRGSLPALTSCLRDPTVMAARPLDVLLKDWGQDDLMPQALKEQVRRVVSL